MVLRLAFAVATCRQPEIILLDEWISTLDDEFLQKAKTRLSELAHRSKVLVMASHQLDLIRALCNKAMFMQHGQLVAFGPIEQIIAEHMHAQAA
jgi:ABC-2 type transport system ATP-binding protein/lipopolysaccharide transport system ATP-binding protein